MEKKNIKKKTKKKTNNKNIKRKNKSKRFYGIEPVTYRLRNKRDVERQEHTDNGRRFFTLHKFYLIYGSNLHYFSPDCLIGKTVSKQEGALHVCIL
jgi:hypothetical protein